MEAMNELSFLLTELQALADRDLPGHVEITFVEFVGAVERALAAQEAAEIEFVAAAKQVLAIPEAAEE